MGKNAQRRRARKQATLQPLRIENVRPGLDRVKLPLPPNPEGHWFAPKTKDRLDKNVLDRLGMTYAAIHMFSMSPQRTELPVAGRKAKYRALKADVLDRLEHLKIPTRTETPLKFSYPDVLLDCLPETVNKERFFDHLSDLLFCYWSILRGVRFVLDQGLDKAAIEERMSLETFLQFVELTEGRPREEVLPSIGVGLNKQTLEAKWYCDAIIVKVRALWDKSIAWLSEDYFGIELNSEKWGDRTRGRIGELQKKVRDALPAGSQRDLLDSYIDQACDLGLLRTLRDSDLHKISQRVSGALGRPGRDQDVLSLWTLVNEFIDAGTESLITCFAIILAGCGRIEAETEGSTDG